MPGGLGVGLVERQPQGLHLGHEVVDVGSRGPPAADIGAGAGAQLEGAGDGLVEPGVEHPQLGLGAVDHRVEARGGGPLGLERLDDGGDGRVELGGTIGLTGARGAGAQLGELAFDAGEVDLAAGPHQRLAPLGDQPGLVDARVDAGRDLAQAVVQRAGRGPVDGGGEAVAGLQGLLHEPSPRLLDGERVDALGPGRPRAASGRRSAPTRRRPPSAAAQTGAPITIATRTADRGAAEQAERRQQGAAPRSGGRGGRGTWARP